MRKRRRRVAPETLEHTYLTFVAHGVRARRIAPGPLRPPPVTPESFEVVAAARIRLPAVWRYAFVGRSPADCAAGTVSKVNVLRPEPR